MGNELKCVVRWGKQKSEGKALLETNEIIFRGEFRLKILFAQIKTVKAMGGELRVETAEGLAVFDLGDAAEKWAHKILHPKSRMEKLGVKAGSKVSLLGEFDEEFLKELKLSKPVLNEAKVSKETEWVFLAVDSQEELRRVEKIGKAMKGAAALWVIYPKGKKEISEKDVIGAGRKAGLKDVKVVGFSATHTALKFVLPVAER